MNKPILFILSGPSGVGKDTVLSRLKELGLPVYFAVTATTRSPRPGERGGVDYHFLSLEEFQRMGDRGELLERACVYGQWYGVPRKEVNEALGRGEDVMVKVDIQGAKTLKGLFPEAVLIFLAPPTWEELVHRLRLRHTETESQFELRLKTVAEEMKAAPLFDYKVVNNKVEEAVECIKAIIIAEKCRLVRQSC